MPRTRGRQNSAFFTLLFLSLAMGFVISFTGIVLGEIIGRSVRPAKEFYPIGPPKWLAQNWTDVWDKGETTRLLRILYSTRLRGTIPAGTGQSPDPDWLSALYLPAWNDENDTLLYRIEADTLAKLHSVIKEDPLEIEKRRNEAGKCCPDWLSGYGIEAWRKNDVDAINGMLDDIRLLIDFVSDCFDNVVKPKTFPVWLTISYKHVWTINKAQLPAMRKIAETIVDKLVMMLQPGDILPAFPVGIDCSIVFAPDWLAPVGQKLWAMKNDNLLFLHTVFEDLDKRVNIILDSKARMDHSNLIPPNWLNSAYFRLWTEKQRLDVLPFIMMRAEVALAMKSTFLRLEKTL